MSWGELLNELAMFTVFILWLAALFGGIGLLVWFVTSRMEDKQ